MPLEQELFGLIGMGFTALIVWFAWRGYNRFFGGRR